jgi:hypothetical protein
LGKNVTWDAGQPAAATGKCLALSMTKSGALLTTADCAASNKVICEVSTNKFHFSFVHVIFCKIQGQKHIQQPIAKQSYPGGVCRKF